jgi:hypothetical protein
MSKKIPTRGSNTRKAGDADTLIETTPFYIIRSRVILSPIKKIKNPTYFLTHQLNKPLNIDAVKLVKEIRRNL